MRSSRVRIRIVATSAALVVALLGLVVAAPGALANGGNPNPGVLPINSHAYGASYGEWSAQWWRWVYSLPVAENPWFDETGEMAANGQAGHVFFLVGVINVSGTA